MIDLSKKYYSKILLFGEHIVIKGADALAMPLERFAGQWAYAKDGDAEALQYDLKDFAKYLHKQDVDIDAKAFIVELDKGLYFDSDIPNGFGAGSSGALVAAIYDCFAMEKQTDFVQLKTELGVMESFFHGSSSGTDPLISYVEKAIHIQKKGIEAIELPNIYKKSNACLFLLNTHIARQTGPFVEIFLKKYTEPRFADICESTLIPTSNLAIDCFINQELDVLRQAFSMISNIQLEYFAEFIPKQYYQMWDYGNSQDLFSLKLCGAGGGGFILGLTFDWAQTKELLKSQELIPVAYL